MHRRQALGSNVGRGLVGLLGALVVGLHRLDLHRAADHHEGSRAEHHQRQPPAGDRRNDEAAAQGGNRLVACMRVYEFGGISGTSVTPQRTLHNGKETNQTPTTLSPRFEQLT